MGEIGISPDRFKYGLRWWEIRCIIRGYNRRTREPWSMARWQTYNLMCAIPYCDLSKAGIQRPTDLIRFPWEREQAAPITEDEQQQLIDEMKALNEQVNP